MARVVDAAQSPFERKPPKRGLAYVGWLKTRRGSWHPVVQAATEKVCWRLLLDFQERGAVDTERCVTKANEKPPR